MVTVPTVPQGCPKVRRILEIWASGHGVVSVLCFQNCVPAEAYTRESCLVEALGEWDPRGGGGRDAVLVLSPLPALFLPLPPLPASLCPTPCRSRGAQPILGDTGTLGSPVAPKPPFPAGKAARERVLVGDTGLWVLLGGSEWGFGC